MKNCIWLSDFKITDHIGGAELVNDILVNYKPSDINIVHIHLYELTEEVINQVNPDFFIFDSITTMWQIQNMPIIILNIIDKYKFFVLEHDYNKVSRYRHLFQDGDPFLNGDDGWCLFYKKFWSSENRLHTFFMSIGQMNNHLEKIHDAKIILNNETYSVMSSCIYSKEDLDFIKKLNSRRKSKDNYYLIFDTENKLKGKNQSIKFAEDNNLNYKLFSNLSSKQLFMEFSKSLGLIYMPTMHDVCPRITVEAKILGGKVYTNDYSQHHKESWFVDSSIEECIDYIESRPNYFWQKIKERT